MVIGAYISIITLNVNGLNAPTKRHRLAGWVQDKTYIYATTDLQTFTDWQSEDRSSDFPQMEIMRKMERISKWQWSRVQLSATPWTVAYTRFLRPWDFSRQEYWSGSTFPSPGDLAHSGIKPGSLALQADALPSEPPGKLTILISDKTDFKTKAVRRNLELIQF